MGLGEWRGGKALVCPVGGPGFDSRVPLTPLPIKIKSS